MPLVLMENSENIYYPNVGRERENGGRTRNKLKIQQASW